MDYIKKKIKVFNKNSKLYEVNVNGFSWRIRITSFLFLFYSCVVVFFTLIIFFFLKIIFYIDSLEKLLNLEDNSQFLNINSFINFCEKNENNIIQLVDKLKNHPLYEIYINTVGSSLLLEVSKIIEVAENFEKYSKLGNNTEQMEHKWMLTLKVSRDFALSFHENYLYVYSLLSKEVVFQFIYKSLQFIGFDMLDENIYPHISLNNFFFFNISYIEEVKLFGYKNNTIYYKNIMMDRVISDQKIAYSWNDMRDRVLGSLIIGRDFNEVDIYSYEFFHYIKEEMISNNDLETNRKKIYTEFVPSYITYLNPIEVNLSKAMNLIIILFHLSGLENLNDLNFNKYNELKDTLRIYDNWNHLNFFKFFFHTQNKNVESQDKDKLNFLINNTIESIFIDNFINILDKLSSIIVGKLTILLDYAVYYFNNKVEILEELEKNNINISVEYLDIFFNFILDFFRTIQFLLIFSKVSIFQFIESFNKVLFNFNGDDVDSLKYVLETMNKSLSIVDTIENTPEILDKLLPLKDIKNNLLREDFEKVLNNSLCENNNKESVDLFIKDISEKIYNTDGKNIFSDILLNLKVKLTTINKYFIFTGLIELYFIKLFNSSLYLPYNLFFSIFEKLPIKYPNLLQNDFILKQIIVILENSWNLDSLIRFRTNEADLFYNVFCESLEGSLFCDKFEKYFNYGHPWIVKKSNNFNKNNDISFIDIPYYYKFIKDIFIEIIEKEKIIYKSKQTDIFGTNFYYILYIKDNLMYEIKKKEILVDFNLFIQEPNEINLIKFLEKYKGIISSGLLPINNIKSLKLSESVLIFKSSDSNYFHLDKNNYSRNTLIYLYEDCWQDLNIKYNYDSWDFLEKHIENVIISWENTNNNMIKYRLISSLMSNNYNIYNNFDEDYFNVDFDFEAYQKEEVNIKIISLNLCPISNSISNLCYNEDYYSYLLSGSYTYSPISSFHSNSLLYEEFLSYHYLVRTKEIKEKTLE